MSFDATSPEQGFALSGKEKLSFVSEMFDRIASSYDWNNLFISLGQTSLWRWAALGFLGPYLQPKSKVLDVGCGTGAACKFMRWRYPKKGLRVEGLDCSRKMLEIAEATDPTTTYSFGDACNMPYSDGEFDVVMTVYTLRNFPSLDLALQEMMRVLKPGGMLLILDAFPPSNRLMLLLLKAWLQSGAALIAGLFAERKAYNYLSTSIMVSEQVDLTSRPGDRDPNPSVLADRRTRDADLSRSTYSDLQRNISHIHAF